MREKGVVENRREGTKIYYKIILKHLKHVW
jgi:hypothetical protein